ncbi:hypothetical protein [Clostridium sp.]|uniref:hypothetical protein n=1 Tax=Clostridium sp. TaxID=1506 RepID=UPI00352264A9
MHKLSAVATFEVFTYVDTKTPIELTNIVLTMKNTISDKILLILTTPINGSNCIKRHCGNYKY